MRLIYLAFFLSGVASLIYEVVWARILGLTFGTTTYAISTVLAVFFLGLAIGSFIFGRLIEKSQKPLLIYGLLEISIGIYAILTPQIFKIIGDAQVLFWQNSTPGFFGFSPVTFILSVLGLILPTILIGGTLPVVSTVVRKISLLYAINTAGAVMGTILAGFILIIVLGVNGTIYFAAVINILIGVVMIRGKGEARLLSQAKRCGQGESNIEIRVKGEGGRENKKNGWMILVLYAISGFGALALEVLWTRVLTLIIGSSTYAFSIMLATFLSGIALGSVLISRFIDKKEKVLPLFVVTQILIGIFVILSIFLFNRLPLLFLQMLVGFREQFWMLQIMEFFLCGIVLFIPALLMGIAFPIMVKIYQKGSVGMSVGSVYGVNTLGGVVGSITAGFLLIPLFGTQKSILMIGLIYLCLALIIFMFLPVKKTFKILTVVVILGVTLWGFLLSPWDKNILSSGIYLYGDSYMGPSKPGILFFKEGAASTVAVRKDLTDKSLLLQINGKFDASSKTDLPTELLSGHLPLIFHPFPANVLVIGLGSGVSLGAVEQYSELKSVNLVEIEPAIIEAAKFFSVANNQALDDPRLNLVVGDGRNYLLATRQKYDVITAEPSNLWIAGMGNLFTKEYFELMRSRLNENGIVLQWIHLYGLSPLNLKTVIKTFQAVFPNTTVWTIEPGMKDLALIGFTGTAKINYDLVKDRFKREEIKTDLNRAGIETPEQLFSYFLFDSQLINKFTAGAPLNTDNYPVLEFSSPKNVYNQTLSANLENLKPFLKPVTPELNIQFEIRKNLLEAEVFSQQGDNNKAITSLEEALKLDLKSAQIKEKLIGVLMNFGSSLLEKGEGEQALEQFNRILEIDPTNGLAITQVGTAYLTQGKLKEAQETLQKAILTDPLLSRPHMNLGVIFAQQKEFTKAEAEFKKVIELEPASFEGHNNLAQLYWSQKEPEKVMQELQESLKINPYQPQIRELLDSLRKI